MKRRMCRSPETIFTQVFLVVTVLGLVSVAKFAYDSSSTTQTSIALRSLQKRDQEVNPTVSPQVAGALTRFQCRSVHQQTDQCTFVRENCADEDAGLLSYLQLFYCTLSDVKPLAFIILAAWTGVLFSTIGIAASDFLCPNLSTIANVLGMSENLAGVTFLAFGNGSPDMFSTFAAFSSHSGSLAVGELMGAAAFITTVVLGSMAITKPFRVGKKTFVRDVVLFTVAAAFSLTFLADGSLRMWECIVMVVFYALYVVLVVVWQWYFDRQRRKRAAEAAARLHQHIPDQQELDVPSYEDDEESRPAAERTPLMRSTSGLSGPTAYTPGTPAWAAEYVDEVDDETRDQFLAALSSNMRVSRPYRERRNTLTPIRPSLIGALEFRSVLSALEKKSTHASPIYMRRYSDDGRNSPGRSGGLPAIVSSPDLLSDDSSQSEGLRVSNGNARNRSVSANDAYSLGIERDLLDVHAGTPDTAIYNPQVSSRPQIVKGDSSRGKWTPQPPRGHPQNFLSPNPIGSQAVTTPTSLTATRNGLLAPPEIDFHRPDYTGGHGQSELGGISPGGISPGAVSPGGLGPRPVSPMALPPRLQIPQSNQASPGSTSPVGLVPRLQIPPSERKSPQELRYTDSPLEIDASQSRPPTIHLPPPSMSPESNHLVSFPDDESATWRQVRWWPYNHLPAPEILLSTLFPGLYVWSEKRWPDKILALCTAPTIFLLTITIPIAESREEDQENDANNDGALPQPPLLSPLPPTPSQRRSSHRVRFLSESPEAGRPFGRNSIVPQIITTDELDGTEPDPNGWNRWLTILQVFTAPLFLVCIIWTTLEDKSDVKLVLRMLLGSLVFSLVALAFLLAMTSPTREPKFKPVLCFLGFFVAIAWVSTIAGEVVGVLKAFGVILNISDAILGLTVFAVGNSLGDLVANITVAKLGFPMMALSACFGGPMLNILLGIGIGGLYQTIKDARQASEHQPTRPIRYRPYEIDINATLLISGATLLLTLALLLVFVPLNKWRMDRKLGMGLIAIWATSTVLNIILEIIGVGQSESISF